MAEDESIRVKRGGFFWTAVNQARFIFGMHASYNLPLEHPLAVFVERFAEAARSGNLTQLATLLAELTEVPPSEEVSALLLAIHRQMQSPALDAAEMRKLCRFYRMLVELLPTNPWLYRLVASEVRHWNDATPDRLLCALMEVYGKRGRLRKEDNLALLLTWGEGPRVKSKFQQNFEGNEDDYGETDGDMVAIMREGKFPAPLQIGPRRLTLPLKQLPVPKSPIDN